MTKLDERVVATELIVGVNRDETEPKLSYITYEEDGKLNSETSWREWSVNSDDPIKVSNKFSKGFKIIGNNHGRGSQCRNTDHMLILHPLSNTTFELEMDNFLELLAHSDIIKGKFNKELIFTKKRELVSRTGYSAQIKEHNIKDAALASRKSQKVKPKDQKIGGMYINPTTGEHIIHLGTVEVTMKSGEKHIKHCYSDESWRINHDDYNLRDNILIEPRNMGKRTLEHTYASTPDYSPKTRRPLTENSKYVNIYDNVSTSDLEIFVDKIEEVYSVNEYGNSLFSAGWLNLYNESRYSYSSREDLCTIASIKCNFKEEYEAQK